MIANNEHERKQAELNIDGCKVRLSFSTENQTSVIETVKDILAQSYITATVKCAVS